MMNLSQLMERAGVPAHLAAIARTMIRSKCPAALGTEFSLTYDRPKRRIILEVHDQAVYELMACELQAYVQTSEDRSAPAPGGDASAGAPGVER